jgi:hypothetical protein
MQEMRMPMNVDLQISVAVACGRINLDMPSLQFNAEAVLLLEQ